MIKIEAKHLNIVTDEVSKVGQDEYMKLLVDELSKDNQMFLLLLHGLAQQSLDYDQVMKAALTTFKLFDLAYRDRKLAEANKN